MQATFPMRPPDTCTIWRSRSRMPITSRSIGHGGRTAKTKRKRSILRARSDPGNTTLANILSAYPRAMAEAPVRLRHFACAVFLAPLDGSRRPGQPPVQRLARAMDPSRASARCVDRFPMEQCALRFPPERPYFLVWFFSRRNAGGFRVRTDFLLGSVRSGLRRRAACPVVPSAVRCDDRLRLDFSRGLFQLLRRAGVVVPGAGNFLERERVGTAHRAGFGAPDSVSPSPGNCLAICGGRLHLDCRERLPPLSHSAAARSGGPSFYPAFLSWASLPYREPRLPPVFCQRRLPVHPFWCSLFLLG